MTAPRALLDRLTTPADAVLAAVLVAGAAAETLALGGDRLVLRTALAVLTVAGLALRRRAPVVSALVVAAGASSVAVISDLTVGDPEARVREYLRALA